MSDRTPVICGIGLSDYPVAPDLDSSSHHVQAMQRALVDSGLTKQDIDGYMCAGGMQEYDNSAITMAEYLRIDHNYLDNTMTGGSAYVFYLQHAAAAIREGLCETILVTYGSDMLSRHGRILGTAVQNTLDNRGLDEPVEGGLQFEAPYGNVIAGAYALAAQRHMHQFGTTSEQLAEIAVAARHHAGLNPLAMYREPLTVQDVVSSRMIADPLHKLDCCVISDGGAAFIVTTAERAKDLKQPSVYILGAAGSGSHWNIAQMRDFTVSAGAVAGPKAFAKAGVQPEDIDTIQMYDSFTITVLMLLEDVGFCKKGEGGDFVTGGRLRLGGSLPLNTDGGALSSCHPGMRGIFLVVEAVRQLRGQGGPAQVPDARLALAAGCGGWLSAIGVAILGKEHP